MKCARKSLKQKGNVPPHNKTTSRCIYWTLTSSGTQLLAQSVVERIEATPNDLIFLSGLVVWEVLVNGWIREIDNIEKGKSQATREYVFEKLYEAIIDLSAFQVQPYSDLAQTRYTAIYTKKANVRQTDWKIASHSVVLGATLVTDNRSDFERIQEFLPELQFENWVDRTN